MPVIHLFSAIYRGEITPFIIGRGPPCGKEPRNRIVFVGSAALEFDRLYNGLYQSGRKL